GILRYKPTTVPDVLRAGGESVGIMLQALENFHYDALEITLDGDTDGATAIGLHLKGANPDLYDGHPVEFNLNLEGNLANLLRTNLDSYQIPDRIRERIQGFQR
ncbi:MAG: YdbH domain-containing protein, partial [Pseudomonadota bacterium]